MKTVIISDIMGSLESIIPYGLNLAKKLETEVDIIHVIDSRVIQGVPSRYADSQSIAAGNKQTYNEIILKEKNLAEKKLNILLSKNASKLNYPLKINVNVEETTIDSKLIEIYYNDPSSILLINQAADNHIFISESDIIESCKIFKGLCLLIPPGTEFHEILRIAFPTDFAEEDIDKLEQAIQILHFFQAVYSAIVNKNEMGQNEISEWKEKAHQLIATSVNYHISNEEGDSESDFLVYVEMNKPDLTLIFEKKQGFIKSMFKDELIIRLLRQTNEPVLFLPL